MKKIYAVLPLLFLLAACEQKTAGQRTEEIQTFADPQIQALDKAKAVQGVIDAADDKHNPDNQQDLNQ